MNEKPKGIAEQPDTKTANYLPEFHLESRYPDASRIFEASVPPISELKDSAVFIVDTNVLLLPYKLKAERLDEIRKPLTALIKEKRLFVPGQVAREFARQREEHLSDLYHALSQKMSVSIVRAEYSFLEGIDQFAKLQELETNAIEAIRNYRQSLDELRLKIQSWRWDDPVSLLYRELFTQDVVTECSLSQDNLKSDQESRWKNRISPGYKDRAKDDTGIGDVIIWNTILGIGRELQKPLVFVTGEAKSDWMVQSDKRGLFARFELVSEYWEASSGNAFEIITLSDLLQLFDVGEELVDEVRMEEVSEEEESTEYGPDTRLSGVTIYFTGEKAHERAEGADEFLKKRFPRYVFSTEIQTAGSGAMLEVEFDIILTLRHLDNMLQRLGEYGIHNERAEFWLAEN